MRTSIIKNMARHYAGKIVCIFCFLLFTGFGSCREPEPSGSESPPGYNLNKPTTKFVMDDALHEISGIAFVKGNSDTMYAIEDENGKLFYFHPGDGKFASVKFGKRGDYEDVAILPDREVVVLRSDGSLFAFPLSLSKDEMKGTVRDYEHILPEGEYEGLFAAENGQLIALCKNCPVDNQRENVTVYTLQKDASGNWAVASHFEIDVSQSTPGGKHHKEKFHPSCLAHHPLTHQWWIISSVNKILLVLDEKWKVTGTYSLDPLLFKQPEGIAFDSKGNLYISNEGGDGSGNVLLFAYRQPN